MPLIRMEECRIILSLPLRKTIRPFPAMHKTAVNYLLIPHSIMVLLPITLTQKANPATEFRTSPERSIIWSMDSVRKITPWKSMVLTILQPVMGS